MWLGRGAPTRTSSHCRTASAESARGRRSGAAAQPAQAARRTPQRAARARQQLTVLHLAACAALAAPRKNGAGARARVDTALRAPRSPTLHAAETQSAVDRCVVPTQICCADSQCAEHPPRRDLLPLDSTAGHTRSALCGGHVLRHAPCDGRYAPASAALWRSTATDDGSHARVWRRQF